MLCKRCVLPENKPYIYLNEEGVCNICLDFDRRRSKENAALLEFELIKVLEKYKGKGKYDCLVMCSGGKDSTSSLYFIKKRYRLNPLAFTFDNGFESEGAIANVRNAVEKLKVDWLYFKSDFMQEMFSEVIKTKSKFSLCPLCSLWYIQLTYQVATQYDLALIISGWTQGQLTSPVLTKRFGSGLQPERMSCILQPESEFLLLCEQIPPFIDVMRKKYKKYSDFPKSMNDIKKKYRISKKAMILSPHWFLPYDPKEYVELIKNELGWKKIEFSYPAESTNCYLNVLGSYLSMQAYGFTHFHVEMSKLVRLGKLSRQEALDKLDLDINIEPGPSIIMSVLKKLGCAKGDL
ncbi:MAG: hypothetical protein KJ880_03090 [Candidatus Omnitrophica bacterium]|nr:hypothetical protein [Candidatus Omnitrophota bacterium]MBU1869703.1 hypothetical protein [Candidatus Omnitrophota bacterium]